MKKGIFDRRIPTLFAVILLLGGLVVTSILVQQGIFIVSKASPNEEPRNVTVTNVTNNSFTVVFTTVDPTEAAVSIQHNGDTSLFYDQRTPQGGVPFSNHSIIITGLTPETDYGFSILSNGQNYKNGEVDYEATTAGGTASSKTTPALLSGKILLPDGLPGKDVLVLASIPNAAAVSAISNDEGEYSFPKNYIRNVSHDTIVTLKPNTKIKLTVYKNELLSEISFTYVPGVEIPTITLSNNYQFTASEEEQLVSTPSSLLEPPIITNPAFKITVPQDGQKFVDQRPQFQGTAKPNTTVKIKSTDFSAQVKSSPNGTWAYRPGVLITPGSHTLSVTGTDSNGAVRTLSSDFTVFKSGSQIAESATPSATPSLVLTPTLTPTPTTPVVSPTPSTAAVSPTPTLTPTPTPTLEPTPTPTIVAVVPTHPTSQTPLPPTGNTTQTIFLTTMSVIFIVAGSALLFIL